MNFSLIETAGDHEITARQVRCGPRLRSPRALHPDPRLSTSTINSPGSTHQQALADHIISDKRLQEQLRLRLMAPDRRAECSTYNDLLLETLSRFLDIHKEPRDRSVQPHHDWGQHPLVVTLEDGLCAYHRERQDKMLLR